MMHSFDQLEKLLNYQFVNRELLKIALTHSSAAKNNNERVEFLGDSIVNFVVGNYLYNKFPEAQEGQLSRMRAALVKGEALSELSKSFNVSDALIVGPGETRINGNYHSSILAGTMEAIIGAVYLDSNFETCQACVMRWYGDTLKEISLEHQYVDPKTQLQEILQSQKKDLPSYAVMSQKGGAQKQVFTVSCTVAAFNEVTTAQGGNRKQAEQAAAAMMIERIKHDK